MNTTSVKNSARQPNRFTATASAGCLIATVLFMLATGAFGAPAGAPLTKLQQSVRDSLINVFPVASCCGTTLRKCLVSKKKCPVARHLETFLTWLVGTDPDPDPVKVREQLDLRYESFTTAERISFDTAHCQITGPENAPVVVQVYVSARCPSCKRYVGELRNAILADSLLRDRVALIPKPVGGGIGNVALFAAAQEGTFWELFFAFRHVYTMPKDTTDIIPIAAKAGILTERFMQRLADPATLQYLKNNTEESRRNEVKYLPGYFINGKNYSSYKEIRWIIDALHLEVEQLPDKKSSR